MLQIKLHNVSAHDFYMPLNVEGSGFVRLIYSYIDLNTIAGIAIQNAILLTSY